MINILGDFVYLLVFKCSQNAVSSIFSGKRACGGALSPISVPRPPLQSGTFWDPLLHDSSSSHVAMEVNWFSFKQLLVCFES